MERFCAMVVPTISMKKTLRFLLILAALALTGSLRAFDPTKPFPKTEVVFFEPEKFTDIRDASLGDSESAHNAVVGELREYIAKQANRLLAPGQVLKITVPDIDLAGEVEPWHAAANDVRVVREIYPPRITLAFRLTDAAGNIVAQGDRSLVDRDFMMRLSITMDDSRRYEKAMIDDWLRKEFGGLKAMVASASGR